MVDRIAWMNDLSERADACLGPVRALARLDGAEVVLVHATGSLGDPERGEEGVPEPLRQRARAHLDPLAERLRAEGVACEVCVRAGQPEELAADVAGGNGLVVAGTTGATGLDRLLLGSTALRLVRRLRGPVLVVGRRPFDRLRSVLAAIDPDVPQSVRAARRAADLAERADAELTFLCVAHRGRTDAAEARLRAWVARVLDREPPARWLFAATAHRRPAEGILVAARSFDLVVVSPRGRAGLEHLLSRSVAEAVIRSCPVSALVVR